MSISPAPNPFSPSRLSVARLPPEAVDQVEAFDGPRVRVAWLTLSDRWLSGESAWLPPAARTSLQEIVRVGTAAYGPGTHWLEEEPSPVSQATPDNERESAG